MIQKIKAWMKTWSFQYLSLLLIAFLWTTSHGKVVLDLFIRG
ncbi:hypothetical protein SCA6_018530 [Theobroma cacao]